MRRAATTPADGEMTMPSATATRTAVGPEALAHLVDADYADAFSIATSAGRSAEEWARRALEGGAQAPRRAFAAIVWHGILGFRLAAPAEPATLAGWSIVENEPGTLVLHADGRLMTGCMVFEATDTRLTWTTLLRYERPGARHVWAVAAHAHRKLAPTVLTRVARSSRT